MFGIILITIVTLVQAYVFLRISSVPFIKKNIPLKIFISVGVLLWGILIAGRMYGHHHTGVFAVALEFTGMNWMAIVFLVFVFVLAVDMITLFGFLMPNLSPKLRGGALIIGVFLSGISLVQGLRPPVFQRYDVYLDRLPASMNEKTVVAMSDLHIGSMLGEKWLAARVAQVREAKPDMVLLLGDIFEGHDVPSDHLLAMLGAIHAPLGVWAVLGNHEFHRNRYDQPRFIEETYFRVLRNQWAEITPGFILAGVDDLTALRRSGNKEDLIPKALKNRPPGATMLLSHSPLETEIAAKQGVGLMLAGHTHGGQLWPFNYLTRRFYPLMGGRYDINKMTVIVCRGTGTWGPRMRLWRPAEILKITLYTKPNS